VFHLRRVSIYLDMGERMRPAGLTHKERSRTGNSCGSGGPPEGFHHSAIGVLAWPAEMPLEMIVLRVFLPT